MDISRRYCCCFSGHRPEKLNLPEAELRAMLKSEIYAAIADGYRVFISGMARGVDVYAAEEVLLAAETDPDVRLICAYPYSGSCDIFTLEWRERCRAISLRADMRVDTAPQYVPSCYQARNRWMVDRSSRLIAVFNCTPGGTRNTVAYAVKQGLDVRVILLDR